MADSSERPIIIVRKKASHGGHHGGAWKVAYADFVTAMMALFIVLWLMNTNKQVQEAVGGYFKDPTGKSRPAGAGQTGSGAAAPIGSGENFAHTRANMAELKDQLQKSMQQMTDFDRLKNQIEMTVTAEGLRIEMMESEKGTFFDTGAPSPNSKGKQFMVALAQQLATLPNKISIEGHTDSKPYVGKSEYSNWELAADRANAARRIMQQNGLRADQVMQVRGFADQHLRHPEDPLNPSNRRISLIVQYVVKDPPDPKDAAKEAVQAKPEPAQTTAQPNPAAP